MELFPIFVKLEGRPCLVVGAGRVAESKVSSLVRCGAKVRVVAPEATDAIRRAAETGQITWEQRAFVPADLSGMFLVVAATSSPELHEQIFRQARQDGILCNAVDEPTRCDFYYPAVVRREPLQIAISTGGHAPVLAQRIREDLERQFGPEYGPWVAEVGRARSEMMAEGTSPAERLSRLRKLSSEEAFEEYRAKATNGGKDESKSGKVYFVGAGPGDPELLTRKAWRMLRSAEAVLHDALVSPEILAVAPQGATIRSVGKRCGNKSITQEEIHALLIAHARAGQTVVRLQGGDPLIFGRAGEEIAALRAAEVDFEIVPGVTAAAAAAAAVQAALTDRRVASKLVFLSGHRRAGELQDKWKFLGAAGGSAAADTTFAIYMPGGSYARVARELVEAGLSPETPCAIVSQASTDQQSILRLDLASLPHASEMPPPAVLLVGAVVADVVPRVGSMELSGAALTRS